MGVEKYTIRGRPFWKIDEWLTLGDDRVVRFRQRKIPTKEMALALIAKKRAEAFEGRFFERRRDPAHTIGAVWELYEPVCERDNDSWLSDKGRAQHLLYHLGARRASRLTSGRRRPIPEPAARREDAARWRTSTGDPRQGRSSFSNGC